MKIQEPACYAAFACTAGDCPDTCCRSWEVVIDEKTRQLYDTLEGKLGDYVRSCLQIDADGDCCMKSVNGACPMLQEDGLCILQKTWGESVLSQVCDRYPRFVHEYGSLTERGISLSCPVACELILDTPFSLVETVTNEPPALNDLDPDLYFAVLRGRAVAFRIAEDLRFPVAERMALLLAFAEELEDAFYEPKEVLANWSDPDRLPEFLQNLLPSRRSDFRKLTAVYLAMEPLNGEYPALLAELNRFTPLPDEIMAQRILQYFLFKYFLQAAYDGRLLKKVQLAASVLLLCGAMFAVRTPQSRAEEIDLLHRCSRELEHSEPNLACFYRWAGRKRQTLFRALLLRHAT